jgi:hypothetical protein
VVHAFFDEVQTERQHQHRQKKFLHAYHNMVSLHLIFTAATFTFNMVLIRYNIIGYFFNRYEKRLDSKNGDNEKNIRLWLILTSIF